MGSSGSSSNTSKPLTGAERSNIFNYGMRDITGSVNNPALNIDYQAPIYQSSGPYQGLSNGDYNALQQSLYSGATAGLKQYEQDARDNIDQSLSDRGLWSSGIAQAAQNDLTNSLADNYQNAGANAAAQRYGLQAQDLAQQNAYNQGESQFANQFNVQNANQNYASQWAPLEYLQGLYNQTGGVITNQKQSNWGIL